MTAAEIEGCDNPYAAASVDGLMELVRSALTEEISRTRTLSASLKPYIEEVSMQIQTTMEPSILKSIMIYNVYKDMKNDRELEGVVQRLWKRRS